MSDGVVEKKRQNEHSAKKRADPDDYSRSVARVAVGQVCQGVGFEAIKHSALEALSDITVRYICDLGKSARYYANLAGRSESNVFDIVKGLEDLGATRGFMGASALDYCSTSSGPLKEVADYVTTVEEIPLAQPIPQFPVSKNSGAIQSISHSGEAPSVKHIPEWLPAFPEPHTYLNSPVWNERRAGAGIDNAEQVRQRRKAESSLLRLQRRLLASSSAPSGFANNADGFEESGAVDGNLFLGQPLLPGEKEVSQITVPIKLVSREPNKKHGSFVQMFAPAIDAVKGREPDSMDVDRGLPFERRTVVHFRLKAGKKLRGENVDVNLRNRSEEERVPALSMDEERDEKKRKAEQILRQSMSSPRETAQNVN